MTFRKSDSEIHDRPADSQRVTLSSSKLGFSQAKAFFVAILLSSYLWFLSPMGRVDRVWSDFLLVNQKKPSSDQIVIVNIDSADLIEHGLDRIDRHHVANTLQLLHSSQVKRVLIDYTLGGKILPEEEAVLKEAFGRFGPNGIAIGFETNPDLKAPDSIQKHATIVDLRIRADQDGRFRGIYTPNETPAYEAAAWLATGNHVFGSTSLDLRIDPLSYQRLSLKELHASGFDRSRLKDKIVIFGLDRVSSRTRASLPISGPVDRSTLFALATQSRLSQYHERETVSQVVRFLTAALCLGVCFFVGLLTPTVRRAMIGFAMVFVAVLGVSLLTVYGIGTRSEPTATISAAFASLYVAIAHRLRLAELLYSFCCGNLSPEEVWLWRSHGESAEPTILFDAAGRVKRANQLAIAAFGIDSASYKTASPLACLCIPGLGKRSSTMETEIGKRRCWKLEWPHESLPLVQFQDITSSVEHSENLQRKLQTDALTGTLNRAGFEDALQTISESQSPDYTLYFMDMNGFKQVNDQHGHEAGDELLKIASERLTTVLRSQDSLARIGGDEFAALVRGSSSEVQALDLRNRLEASLNDPIPLRAATVKVGVAVGFAYPQQASESTSSVLKRADLEMYERKAFLKSQNRGDSRFDRSVQRREDPTLQTVEY